MSDRVSLLSNGLICLADFLNHVVGHQNFPADGYGHDPYLLAVLVKDAKTLVPIKSKLMTRHGEEKL